MMRVVNINNLTDIEGLMKQLKVDSYGIQIMAPKACRYLIKIDRLSPINANILKQEMLSLGGDLALPRDALTGKLKHTDCLLIGNLSQLGRLAQKLKIQPFGLAKISDELNITLSNHLRSTFQIKACSFRIKITDKPIIMGILNLTPDSFSSDGLYKGKKTGIKNIDLDKIINRAQGLIKDGAGIIDIGGESTRPGAKPVSLSEELKRTIPVIKLLAKRIKVPISIDTHKPQVAKQALDNGAVIVNDITGLKDSKMRKIVAAHRAASIIMHMQGNPLNMQNNPEYKSVIDDIAGFLNNRIKEALDSGIDKNSIIIDPGIGFGKTVKDNTQIINRLNEFKSLGYPLLIGPSRKSFIGKLLNNAPPQARLNGTISACILGFKNGANIFRVHDVKQVCESIKVAEAILN